MTVLSILLMITLGRPQSPMPITPNQPAPYDRKNRSLSAAPARSLCPPLDSKYPSAPT